jgi:hypothetical protein
LRRLERLYELGEYRLDLAHGQERRTGVIDPAVDRQARVVMEIVVRMHGLKMDLGLTGERERGVLIPSPERLEEIKERYGEPAATAFADPVQRAQVLGLLKRVLRLRERADIDDKVVDGDSGTSATVRPEANEGTASGRAADYVDPVEDDDDEGLGGPR